MTVDYRDRPSGTHPGAEQLLSFNDILRFLRRQRILIAVVVVVFFALGVIACIVAKRRYSAEALIEIKQPEDTLGINHLVQGSAQGDAPNPAMETVTLATKVAELQSYQLALRVVDELGLEQQEDFQSTPSLLGSFFSLFSSPAKGDAPNTRLVDSPARRDRVVGIFQKHLKVQNSPGTRLISISYAASDPRVAEQVVNTLAVDLTQNSFMTRQASVEQMSDWLKKQLDTVKANADKLESQEAEIRRVTQTYTLSGTNTAGQNLVYSPVLDQLQQITSSLSAAESNRILRGAIQQIAQTHDPQLLSGLAGSGLAGSGNPQSTTSLDVIKNQQQQIDILKASLSRDELRYGDSNPKLIQERANLRSLQDSLKAETERMLARANNDFAIANEQADLARSQRDKLVKHANELNDQELRYEIVHVQAQDARQLYTDLSNRVSQASVLAGLQADETAVVSKGFAPSRPSSPRVSIILVGSIFGGLICGIVLAGIRDLLEDKWVSPEMIESQVGIPVYSLLPAVDPSGPAYLRSLRKGKDWSGSLTSFLEDSSSEYAGALRLLRTVIMSDAVASRQVILLTGIAPGADGSMTSLNLAATLSRAGARTLLVEADVTNPKLAMRAGISKASQGLSSILAGELNSDWALSVEQVPGLDCIPAGPRTAAFHDLLASEKMEQLLLGWRKTYDVVLLDAPLMLPVADSIQLSKHADLILIVTGYRRTTLRAMRAAYNILSRQNQAPVGAIINAVSPSSEGYYEFYGSRNVPSDYKRMEEI
nr:Wzz/FepE/Etk N-terminal domain-containing protein [Granulicella aggregans]